MTGFLFLLANPLNILTVSSSSVKISDALGAGPTRKGYAFDSCVTF